MRPLVIGHRGASGYRPEHTLEAYRLAAEMGADCIEPDLVATRDGVLVARHENEIGATTDVAAHPRFAGRRTTKVIDGAAVTGWFTEDFAYEELRELRATERIPQVRPLNAAYDGRFAIPTFREVLALRAELSRRLGREIRVYPETKHPSYFRSIGLALEAPLVAELERAGLTGRDAPVLVQSFEPASLRALRERLAVALVQLIGRREGHAEMATPAGLERVARYADVVGPAKEYVIPLRPDGALGEPTAFVADAHAAGLRVHPYTFRRENAFLPADFHSSGHPSDPGDLVGELRAHLAAGVDGFFTDNPDLGLEALG